MLTPIDTFLSDIARLPVGFVNVYFVGQPGSPWTLVDTGLPNTAALTIAAAAKRYGEDSRPEAIVLTHGHFDHAGSAQALAEHWDVPIYAHALELPYLDGRSDFAPQDPTMGGAIAFLSRFFPHAGYDLRPHLCPLPEDGVVPTMPGWQWLYTPGHTHGHISLWRASDRVLLAGDAIATMDLDSWTAQVTKPRVFDRPPAPFTPHWGDAYQSAQLLADLEPLVVAAGHGLPIQDGDVPARLRRYVKHFDPPMRGRYTEKPAIANEDGIVSVPPPAPDPLPLRIGVGAAGATVLAGLLSGRKRR